MEKKNQEKIFQVIFSIQMMIIFFKLYEIFDTFHLGLLVQTSRVRALSRPGSVDFLNQRICVGSEPGHFIQSWIQDRIKTILCSTPHTVIQNCKFASINKRPSSHLPLFFRSLEIKSILRGPIHNFYSLKNKSDVVLLSLTLFGTIRSRGNLSIT